MNPTTTSRIESIDVFRGLTMMLMLFVNDLWRMSGVPHWMQHAEINEDMLGLADVVFPTFLFIVGMSIPLAVAVRIAKGDSYGKIVLHTLWRSVALFTMGIFLLNRAHIGDDPNTLSELNFTLLMVLGFYLIWGAYPANRGWKDWKLYISFLGRLLGIGLLTYLAWQYVSKNGNPFSANNWWEILGLIGWTYFITSIVYFHTKDRLGIVFTVWIAMMILCVLNQAGILKLMNMENLRLPSTPVHHTLGWGGVFTAVFLLKYGSTRPFRYIAALLVLAAALFGCGTLSHQFWIISKNGATVPWLFYCTALALTCYAVLFLIVDVCKGKRLFFLASPAGKATLTCYIMPYPFHVLYWAYLEKWLPACVQDGGWFRIGGWGLLHLFLYVLVIVGLTQLFIMCRIRLKL
ncbi:MAG: DUF5009 domain-containing protein [Planctomycetaceae bacterium]|nr:DUF5009 domain-containing protein [Planctomycetaceae bacterium]